MSAKCEGCWYWKPLGGTGGTLCCTYMVMHGKRRERDGDKCLSRTTEEPKRVAPESDTNPVASIYTGYKMN